MSKNTIKKCIIAIDGGVGTGKSTIAKLLAKRLGIMYIDTGAMYRAAGLYFLRKNISLKQENEQAINDELKNIDIFLTQREDEEKSLKVTLNGEDVSEEIRTSESAMAASNVSKFKEVRKMLVDIQRRIAGDFDVVLEGRDIASVVFPNANLKIFLSASVDERASRRLVDLLKKGENITFERVKEDVLKRDMQDTTRKESPLIKVHDALEIDTTNKSIDEVCDIIIDLLKKKGFAYEKDS